MTLFIKLQLLLSLFLVGCAANDFLSKRGSISFNNADITVAVKTEIGVRVAEAFNATLAPFIRRRCGGCRSDCRVFSPEQTDRRRSAVRSNQSLFEFAPGGFYAYIETLSESVAAELAKEARKNTVATLRHPNFCRWTNTSEASAATSTCWLRHERFRANIGRSRDHRKSGSCILQDAQLIM